MKLSINILAALLAFQCTIAASRSATEPAGAQAGASAHIPKQELQREAQLKKLSDSAEEAYQRGNYEQALNEFQQVIAFCKQLTADDEKDVRFSSMDKALDGMAGSYTKLGRYKEAEAAYLQLVALRKEAAPYDSSTAGAYAELAALHGLERDWAKAQDYMSQAVSYVDECISHFKKSDDYDPQDRIANGDRSLKATLLMYLGNVYGNQGNFQEALSRYDEAYQTAEKFRASNWSPRSVTSPLEAHRHRVRVTNSASGLRAGSTWKEIVIRACNYAEFLALSHRLR